MIRRVRICIWRGEFFLCLGFCGPFSSCFFLVYFCHFFFVLFSLDHFIHAVFFGPFSVCRFLYVVFRVASSSRFLPPSLSLEFSPC